PNRDVPVSNCDKNPSSHPPPRSGEGEQKGNNVILHFLPQRGVGLVLLPLSASGRGVGGGVTEGVPHGNSFPGISRRPGRAGATACPVWGGRRRSRFGPGGTRAGSAPPGSAAPAPCAPGGGAGGPAMSSGPRRRCGPAGTAQGPG